MLFYPSSQTPSFGGILTYIHHLKCLCITVRDYHEYIRVRDYHEYIIMMHVESYHEYSRGSLVHWRVTINDRRTHHS